MMNDKLVRLAKRRELLVAQAAAQRIILAQNIAPWRAPLALADQGLAVLRFIRRHAVWVAGGGLLLGVLRPAGGSVGKWMRRAWVGWQIVRKLRATPEK
jgi:hypothetical protein